MKTDDRGQTDVFESDHRLDLLERGRSKRRETTHTRLERGHSKRRETTHTRLERGRSKRRETTSSTRLDRRISRCTRRHRDDRDQGHGLPAHLGLERHHHDPGPPPGTGKILLQEKKPSFSTRIRRMPSATGTGAVTGVVATSPSST